MIIFLHFIFILCKTYFNSFFPDIKNLVICDWSIKGKQISSDSSSRKKQDFMESFCISVFFLNIIESIKMRASVCCLKKMCCFHEKLFEVFFISCLLSFAARSKNLSLRKKYKALLYTWTLWLFCCVCVLLLLNFICFSLLSFGWKKATSRITGEANWFNIKRWMYWKWLQVTSFLFVFQLW